VKLIRAEAESDALREYLGSRGRHVSSIVAAVEVPRAIGRNDPEAAARVGATLQHIHLVELDRAIVGRAAVVGPGPLRTLDAIHLATALELGSDLDALVTYDGRLADAARALGISVISPS
jgi:predicted nucleic acid-binding protein